MKQANKSYILYCHKNLINGKAYYGITRRSPERRWGKNGIAYKSNTHFWNAIQKYGWDGFSHNILFDGLDSDNASKLEQEYIAKYNTNNPLYGYNHTFGGESHYELSEDSKVKMREATKNRVYTDEWRQHLGESHKGLIPWNKGISPSDETREKLSIAGLGRTHRAESIILMREKSWNKKSVIVDGKIFDSIQLCANYLGIKRNRLTAWLNSDESVPEEYVKRGLSFYGVPYQYVESHSEKYDKRVFCDGMYFDSMSACEKYYNLPRCTITSWINGRRKMPQDFIDKGLKIEPIQRYFYTITE